jgi:hypothetical protein
LIVSVPDEGYSNLLIVSVPDEGYSRNPSCAFNLISTFLLKYAIFKKKKKKNHFESAVVHVHAVILSLSGHCMPDEGYSTI